MQGVMIQVRAPLPLPQWRGGSEPIKATRFMHKLLLGHRITPPRQPAPHTPGTTDASGMLKFH